MCGIFGRLSFSEPFSLQDVPRIVASLAHRGPDDEGHLILAEGKLQSCRGIDTDKSLGLPRLVEYPHSKLVLSHRRLSIIDLSSAGHQPMLDVTGRYGLVFNGELYNYRELQKELHNEGITFRTNTDTEVVLQSLIFWGTTAFNKFNGMWALAFWDNKMDELLLSRDRFGVKPLYYTHTPEGIAFASEIKALKKLESFKFIPNKRIISEYLATTKQSYGPETFYDGIFEVLPGHWMEWDEHGDCENTSYWKYEPSIKKWNYPDALCEFSRIFKDSIKIRMRSDVEVGSLLSGGLDSSTIVGTLNELHLITDNSFQTFSAVYDDERFSERKYIDELLKVIPVNAHFIEPDTQHLEDDIYALLEKTDEPIRSLSILSQFNIYRYIRQHTKVKVLLNGQGADELFAGYTNSYFKLFADLFWKMKWLTLIKEMRFFQANRPMPLKRLFITIIGQIKKSYDKKDFFTIEQYNELKIAPLREYLKYDDRTSMAFGLEARAPFLDYRLVEFAYTLPSDFKILNFRNKRIVRDFATDVVPDIILNRTDKMGFVTPQEEWQRSCLKNAFIRKFKNIDCYGDFFDVEKAKMSFNEYLNKKNNNWQLIWKYYCLIVFLEQNITPNISKNMTT